MRKLLFVLSLCMLVLAMNSCQLDGVVTVRISGLDDASITYNTSVATVQIVDSDANILDEGDIAIDAATETFVSSTITAGTAISVFVSIDADDNSVADYILSAAAIQAFKNREKSPGFFTLREHVYHKSS